MSTKYIKQLTVGGFQVFSDPVTVPLVPLILIYGPNSAGKSAILDSMLALADLCELFTLEKTKLAPDRRSTSEILKRHWRREGVLRATPANALRLGAVIRIGRREWSMNGFADYWSAGPSDPRFADSFSCLHTLAKGGHVDVEVSFQYTLEKPDQTHASGNALAVDQQLVELGLGGSPILRWSESARWASINLDHPALLAWNNAVELKWLAQRYKDVAEDLCAYIDGWFEMSLCYVSDSGL